MPRSGNTGPFLDLDGNANGTIEESNSPRSLQAGLSWRFAGMQAAETVFAASTERGFPPGFKEAQRNIRSVRRLG